MKKIKTILLTVILLGLLITGCSSKSMSNQSRAEAPQAVAQENTQSREEMGMVEDAKDAIRGDGQELELGGGAPKRNKDQKLIYRASMHVEVIQKLEPLIQSVQNFVEGHNGYIENMEQYRNGYDPVTQEQLEGISMRIRIPHEHYNKTLQIIADQGTVVNKSSSVEDVTLQYSDIESTLKMYKIEQERLLEMLENKTTDVKDMIEIEKRLSEVRVEIEKQESARRALESQINYDTIDLEMMQVRRTSDVNDAKSFTSRIKSTFIKSVDQFIIFIQNVVLSLTYMLIPISVIAIIIGILYIPISKVRKRRKNRPVITNKKDEDEL